MALFGSALSGITLPGNSGDGTYDPDTVDYVGFRNPFEDMFAQTSSSRSPWDYMYSRTAGRLANPPKDLNSLFNLGNAGPTTRTVEGQGIFSDLNKNQTWDQGEQYDPSSSIWNNWMSQQDTMQEKTTPTAAGIGYVPQNQEQQDYQNAVTMGEYSGDPLTQAERDQYASVATPKKTWKTEMAAGNDWLGDLF